jgi:hypothetical protein
MSNLRAETWLIFLACVSACVSCGSDDPADPTSRGWTAGQSNDSGDTTFEGSLEDARQACVDRINGFRASEGKPPYERWLDSESCAVQQAQLDAEADDGHANFGMCDERAQNSCLRRRSVDSVLNDCLQAMWDEGPGSFSDSGHYLNMSSTEYTRVACVFHQLEDGSVWSNQNYR